MSSENQTSQNGATAHGADASTIQKMQQILDLQKRSSMGRAPSRELRVDRMNRAIDLLIKYQKDITEAMISDFGHRSREQTLLTDVMSSIASLKHARNHLKSWMRPHKRKPQFPLGLLGAKATVSFQPKGVIGLISPWNFPVNLTFAPLAGIFAAGNSAMIKPSEFTEHTSELMARMFREAYDETEVAVFTGGPEVGGAFSKLAFDHLLFTGGTAIAYHVMRAAADNLVPLTLELGGKSPVILSEGADMQSAATKIMTGKMMNAGQICLAPDYAMLPQEHVGDFVQKATESVGKLYPTLKENPDYTSIVNERHYDRLHSYLDDAKQKGAELVEINPAGEDFSQQPHRKMPPTLILNPSDDMKVMQDEIFGPILPVKTYSQIGEAVDYVNSRPRPLGLYYFGSNPAEEKEVLSRTISGGVTINDVIMHVSMEDLPFGGIGPSGMGSYHGYDGFCEFSHAKAVYKQTGVDKIAAVFRPPFGDSTRKLLASQMKK